VVGAFRRASKRRALVQCPENWSRPMPSGDSHTKPPARRTSIPVTGDLIGLSEALAQRRVIYSNDR